MILAHCSQLVWVDRHVKRWEYIGLTGNTGFSFSPHLHLDIREIDQKTGATLNKWNGYGGAIDPTPFWTTNLIQLMTDYIATLAEERAKPGNEWISIFQSIAGDWSLDEKNIKALIEIAFLRAIPIIINKIK
jgi:murein DD-endopeptidase MepM/ murein hydrolase activator NlpD